VPESNSNSVSSTKEPEPPPPEFWFKADSDFWENASTNALCMTGASIGDSIKLQNHSDSLKFRYNAGSVTKEIISDISDAWTTEWHYFAFTWDTVADEAKLFVDATQVGSTLTSLGTYVGTLNGAYLGTNQTFTQQAPGVYDEYQISDIARTPTEILNNYKRGAMDLKFQVRSDDDDSGWGSFIGPDGTTGTYYTDSPETLTNISDNRYFQYKAYYSTDDTDYSPELTSMTVDYSGGSTYATDKPTVRPNTSNAFAYSALSAFSGIEILNGGTVEYQITDDGTNASPTWYYWSGSNWVSAGATDYNTYSEVNSNISQFVTDVGTGEFSFNAFLISDGEQLVKLDNVGLNYLSGSLTADIVDGAGDPVSSPSVALANQSVGFSCQTSTGTLGIASEKIRVNNTTASAAWSLSIAADTGATATWSTGSEYFDFNDAGGSGCTDSGDTDSYGGQLTVNPSVGTITPEGGCSLTGVTKGSSNAFDEGTTDSITLMSANGTSDTGCYWDLTGVDISQKIPAEQEQGSYSMDFTVTVVAI